MILQKGKNNRLLIYFFYDKAGVVDDYIVYMLQKMVRTAFQSNNTDNCARV